MVAFGVTSYASSLRTGMKVRPRRSLIFDYNWPEPDPSIKKYPHENNCHYYYQDEGNNLFTLRKCAKGEIFNYHKHECAKKETGQCWRYGKTIAHGHIHAKLRKLFKCPMPEGNYPDIFDCNKYFQCWNGKSMHKHCHSNKHFDKLKKDCIDKNIAVCADILDVVVKGYKCPRSRGFFGDPKDCSKYYECQHRKPSLKTCENGTLFDEVEKDCKNQEQVNCNSRYNPYEEITHVPTSTRIVVSNQQDTSIETSSPLEKTRQENDTVQEMNEILHNVSTVGNNLTSSTPPPKTTSIVKLKPESTEHNSTTPEISLNSTAVSMLEIESTHPNSQNLSTKKNGEAIH